jgi:hypothetical protein
VALLRGVLLLFALLLVAPRAWADEHEAPEDASLDPSVAPSVDPSSAPSVVPSAAPSVAPSTVPSTKPSAAPSGSTPAASASTGQPSVATVRVHEREVFAIRVPRAGQSAADRARLASQALEVKLEEPDEPEAHVDEQGAIAVVFVGKTPIVTLGEEDAAAEGGAVTLHVHAASVATRVQEALRLERKRGAIATTVFSISLLVFSALMAFLLLGRIGDVEEKLRAWMEKNPDRLPALKLGKIEVVSSAAVRGAISIALRIGERFAQAAVVYGWLLIVLSLFEATRAYGEKLTGYVLSPLSALVSRIGSALPVLVVGLIAALAVILLVRFIGLFFGSVARGETKLGWLPPDLAGPTSVLVRAGIVIASLIVAAPLITGSDEGALSRAGVAALATLALACTPILACAAVGVPIVFGRRLRVGDFVETGGRAGRVRGITLLEVRLEDSNGCEVRVPHLVGLWHSTRIVGRAPIATVEIVVAATAQQSKAYDALLAAAHAVSSRAKVEMIAIDADGARYRVSCPDDPDGKSLAVTVTEALLSVDIALGRGKP